MNRTTPDGALFCEPTTVACRDTGAPCEAGDGEAVSVTVDVRVFAPDGRTYCASDGDTLGGVVALPRYRAVIAWPPVASDTLKSLAVGPDSVAVPSSVAPS